jgi:hypothetical protein
MIDLKLRKYPESTDPPVRDSSEAEYAQLQSAKRASPAGVWMLAAEQTMTAGACRTTPPSNL